MSEYQTRKTLEEIFNGITLSKTTSGHDVADAVRLSKEIELAENTFSRVLIDNDKLTEDGKKVVRAIFNAWVIITSRLEKWQYDDRNKATYNFAVMQSRYLKEVNEKEYPLVYHLAMQLTDIHKTLQQNFMRTLYRYFSTKGERLHAINFPII